MTLDPQDLKIEVFRHSKGAHPNTSSLGIRIIHLPTGTIVVSEDFNTLAKNRAHALSYLKKLLGVEADSE